MSAAPRTAGEPRGHSHQRSTCPPHTQRPRRAPATAATGSLHPPPAAHRSSPLNGSSFDPVCDGEDRGGCAAVDALGTVLRCNPRPAADLPDRELLLNPGQPFDLSPLLHVDHTRFLLADRPRSTWVRTEPDNTDPMPGGSLLKRRMWSSIQSAPTVVGVRREWCSTRPLNPPGQQRWRGTGLGSFVLGLDL
jgi:hypothetical protein